jgi:antitoxin component of MazEF toxin-antitoxin module
MRLQKQLSNVIEGKEYPKFVIIVPPSTVQELEWDAGEELEHEVKDKALIIRKARNIDAEAMKVIAKHKQKRRDK